MELKNTNSCHIKATAGNAYALEGRGCCTRLDLVRGHGPLLPADAIHREEVGAGRARDVNSYSFSPLSNPGNSSGLTTSFLGVR